MGETVQGEVAVTVKEPIQLDCTNLNQNVTKQGQEAITTTNPQMVEANFQDMIIFVCMVPVKVKQNPSNFVYSTFAV